MASGRQGGVRVELCGVCSPCASDQLSLDLVGRSRRWSARFSEAALARPTVITAFDAAGQHSGALRFESSHRRCWQALHQAVAEQRVGEGLDQLARRLGLAAGILGEPAVW